MYRTALLSAPRALRTLRQPIPRSCSRRLLTTAPAHKKGTWKGSALRWGVAIAAVYWYNTSPIFADELPPQAGLAPPQFSESDLPTVDAVIEEKRRQADTTAPTEAPPPPPEAENKAAAVTVPEAGSPKALEEEAGSQGAFDPETGEINWDCPCLGGMAHGPCGEQFKAAFSCFVYSKDEPKGMDCIDKFQHMQDCFRKYPEIYGAELGDDDEDGTPAGVNPDGDATPSAQELDRASEAPLSGTQADNSSAKKYAPVSDATKTDVAGTEATNAESKTETAKTEAEDETLGKTEPSKKVSYAEVTSRGPKQTAEEAAAPQPPQVAHSTATSTSSLIDVDTPSVRTVPSTYSQQDVQTETQHDRLSREAEALERQAVDKAERAKKAAWRDARRADGWLSEQFARLSDGQSGALVAANLAGLVGLGVFVGYKAWGLYERGRLGWKEAGIGVGILGVVGAVEAVFGRYLYKAKKGKGKGKGQ